ncbi:MAG: phytoene desaturase family protein [Acidimicrobiia bacterium]
MGEYDAVVVGAGPNGLAGALELTAEGHRVLVVEGSPSIGGGARTKELTLPGFLHDVCSAIHPMGAASPFFRSRDIGDWIHPDIPATHPLDGGRVAVLHRGLDPTVRQLGPDGSRYRSLVGPLVDNADKLMTQVLGPLVVPPPNPVTLGRFGLPGLLPASTLVKSFHTEEARALFAGLAAHAIAPFHRPLTGAVGILFAVVAHSYGWPLARGGSQEIAEQLAAEIIAGGGTIEVDRTIGDIRELPTASTVLLDVMPDAARRIARGRVAPSADRRLAKRRLGPGVFKVDWALDGPIPWTDEASGRAGTVHVGGTFEEVAAAEAAVHSGDHPERPFVIIAQQSLFDPDRAPGGKQTAWGYCHVPHASDKDMTAQIESQIERFAPGFRDRVLARHTMGSSDFAAYNPNYAGGDIAGGAFSTSRMLQFGMQRPYLLGDGLYLCSSASPPGGGVHGMCGYHAARAAISRLG